MASETSAATRHELIPLDDLLSELDLPRASLSAASLDAICDELASIGMDFVQILRAPEGWEDIEHDIISVEEPADFTETTVIRTYVLARRRA